LAPREGAQKKRGHQGINTQEKSKQREANGKPDRGEKVPIPRRGFLNYEVSQTKSG